MSYLENLMNHERAWTELVNTKKKRSKDKSLDLTCRNKNFYEFMKEGKVLESYRREIEEMADEQFPLHLEIDIHEILNSTAS